MSVNGLGSYTSKSTRITGMGGSGLDVDSIVKSLMEVEKIPVNRVGQKMQLSQWRMEAYRNVTSSLSGFKSTYFDVLTPATNMTSQSTYKKFKTTALDSSTGTTSSVVSATGSASASAGAHKITVTKLATADVVTGTPISKELSGTKIEDVDVAALTGKDFNITLDGVTKNISIGSYTNVSDLASGLQSLISTAFGKTPALLDKIKVTELNGVLTFAPNVATVNKITLGSGSLNDGLAALKFSAGDSNRLSAGLTLGELANKFATPLTFEGGSTNVDSSADITNLALTDKSFSINIDGVTKQYTFTSDPASVNDIASTLDTWISGQFGANKVNVTASGDKLSFTRNSGNFFSLSSGAYGADALTQMNISSGSEASGQLQFTINSSTFTVKASQTLTGMMKTINSDTTAKVNMIYSEVSDQFSITAKQLGSGDNINISQGALSGNFFSGASKIGIGNLVTKDGIDAQVTIDDEVLIRSSNSVTLGGITYNFLRESATEQTVSLTADVDAVYDSIKKFTDQYNTIIASLNSTISEKYEKSYTPLTDEQKSAMTSEDITTWEKKAKTGLLHNDSIIQSALTSMRSALSAGVTGVSVNLSSIGITTGTYDEKGKLYIDEDKLKSAIQNDPDAVMNLFSKQSSISYTQNSQRSQRFSEQGLANRLLDVIQDNIRSTRDSSGNKGTLLEKAGMVGDASEFSSVMFKEIYDYNTKIVELSSRLADKENTYYARFTAMEKAISKMQAQSSNLLSQLNN